MHYHLAFNYFYYIKTQLILKCNDKTMNKTFEFYYHGPKCKYIFNHINLVNKIPSHNKAFKPLYNFIRNKHHNYPNAHGQAQSAYSCHLKKALSSYFSKQCCHLQLTLHYQFSTCLFTLKHLCCNCFSYFHLHLFYFFHTF
jgi:hypothetical protein